MKNNKSNKQAFTIVELVIVIAVIAILAGVLIPVFSDIIEKANLSKDQQYIANANTALALETVDDKYETVFGLTSAMLEYGFDFSKDKPNTRGYHYALDYNDKRLILIDEEWNLDQYNGQESNLYVFLNESEDFDVAKEKGLSMILQKGFTKEELTISSNVDARNANIKKIVYDNSLATASREIYLYTNENTEELIVKCFSDTNVSDTFNHYGAVKNVELIDAGEHSYHEFGIVTGTLNVQKGRVVIEEGSTVEELKGDGQNGVTVERNGGTIKSEIVIEEFCQVNNAILEYLNNDTGANNQTYNYNYDDPAVYKWTGLPEGTIKIHVANTADGNKKWDIAVSGSSADIANLTPGVIYKCDAMNGTEVLDTKYLKATGDLRMIKMAVVANVRDLGGWNADGGKIKYNKLFRGSQFSTVNSQGVYEKITKSGVSPGNSITLDGPVLKDVLGVNMQVDLRMPYYFKNGKDIDGVEYKGISINESHIAAVKMDYHYGSGAAPNNIETVIRYNNTQQSDFSSNTSVRAAYNSTVDALRTVINGVNEGKNIFFHCQAGADRTGTIAFMLEGLLGVTKEDMLTEYSLTAFSSQGNYSDRNKDNTNLKALVEEIEKLPGSSWTDKFIYWFICAGFTPEELNTFRAAMIDGTPSTITAPSQYVCADDFIIHLNKAGNTYQLHPKYAGSPSISYSTSSSATSSSAVATVSSTGEITAVGNGACKITITADYEGTPHKSYCLVHVEDRSVSGVTLNKSNANINKGEYLQLTATVAPEIAENKNVTWSSNAPSIATVDETGKVTAIAAGTATITCTSVDGGKTATCTVTVVDNSITSIVFTETPQYLDCNSTYEFKTSISPSGFSNSSLDWNITGDQGVATIDNGNLTILDKEGTITITASKGSVSASHEITVRKNWLKDSVDANGNRYSNTGFKNGARISSSTDAGPVYESGKESDSYLTGYIEIKKGDTLLFQDLTFAAEQSWFCCAIYDDNKNLISVGQFSSCINAYNKPHEDNSIVLTYYRNKNTSNKDSFEEDKIYYIRLSYYKANTNNCVPGANAGIYITH